jgi:hypothetical protein
MHINFQTYRTIKRSLAQVLHTRRDSHQEQHLNTLTLLICGIVGSQQVPFAQIAEHAPIRRRKNEKFSRSCRGCPLSVLLLHLFDQHASEKAV